MLFAIAVDPRGSSSALMLWRDGEMGELVRAGEHATCDMRLPGAGIASCDVWRGESNWQVRRPDGSVRDVEDGDNFVVGRWWLLLLVDEAPMASGPPTGSHRRFGVPDCPAAQGFESEDRRLADIDDDLPRLLGGGDGCAIKIALTRERFCAVVRRAGRATRIYPVPGTRLAVDGKQIAGPMQLGDGNVLAVPDSPPIRFVDADQELDRLLDSLRDEHPDRPEPDSATPPGNAAPETTARRDPFLTPLEAALACGTLAAIVAQSVVTIARW